MAQRDIAAEFRERRSLTLRLALPWVVTGLVGASITAYIGHGGADSIARVTIYAVVLTVFISFLGRALFIVDKHYRCPSCEAVLTNSDGGPLFFPRKCPACGSSFE